MIVMHVLFIICSMQCTFSYVYFKFIISCYHIIMQENIPDTVTGRYYHSLSVWSVTPTTIWIIVFGGGGGIEVIELSEYM